MISTLRQLRALLMREELVLRRLDLMFWSTAATLRGAPAKDTGEPPAANRPARKRGNGAAKL
ncbi:MAG: hypothetical protein ACE145_07765 [Terriglobia bacterium]